MKKIAIPFTLLLVIGMGIYQANSTDDLSDIQLANVEALASGEGTPSNTGPREEKNVMVVGIKWYVVPLTPNHAVTQVVINFFLS